jgi:hypothetical protein
MQRGKQYIRAIQLYYRKFGAYPPSIDALVKTNNIRFLRKKYIDPITGKDDWKPLLFGQNKAPMAMGFFGQPMGGMGGNTAIAGIGPSGGNTAAGATGTGLGSSFGSSLGSATGSSFGSTAGSSLSSTAGGSLFGSTDSGTQSGSVTGSGTGTGSASSGTTGGSTTSSGASTGSSFMSGQTGQTFGGAGVIGVSPGSPKQSILTYKKKSHYNEWEFVYSPLLDMMKQAGGNTGMIGAPAGSTSGASGSSGFGTSGSSGFGNSTFGGTGNSLGGTGLGSNPGSTQTPSP